MYYTNQEIQDALDDATFLMMEVSWMELRNDLWINNLIKLCHTGE